MSVSRIVSVVALTLVLFCSQRTSADDSCAADDVTCAQPSETKATCGWSPPLNLSPNTKRRHPHGLCWVSESRQYVYLNVAKVASTTLKRLTGHPKLGAASQAQCVVELNGTISAYRPYLGRAEYGDPVSATGFVKFAFVRDPIARFLSGFHTVAKRGAAGGAYGDSKRMPFVNVVHDEQAQMLQFFSDVQRNGGFWEEHTIPQSYYLSHPQTHVPIQLDFIGRAEDFEREWRVVEWLTGLPKVQDLPQKNAAERNTAVANEVSLEALCDDEELLDRVRTLYEQDFLCLNYSLTAPQSCHR